MMVQRHERRAGDRTGPALDSCQEAVRSFADDGFVRIDRVRSRSTLRAREPAITCSVLEHTAVPSDGAPVHDTEGHYEGRQCPATQEGLQGRAFSKRLAGIVTQLPGVDALRHYTDKDPDDALQRKGVCRGRPRPYALRDVGLHSGWILHRAEGNVLTEPRRVLAAINVDADMRVADRVLDRQRHDLEVLMPGAGEDEIPDTSLNSVVYP